MRTIFTQKTAVSSVFILFSFLLPVKATAASYSQIYVFSDSISDTGNVFNVTTTANRFAPTVTIDPPSPPYFNGRYSNGPAWVEYLADDLGLTLTPSTQLAVGSPITITANGELGVNFFFNGATTTRNVNFAFGGAGSGLSNASDPRLPGILREVQAFTDDLTLANKSADPNALYIVWAAGSNDYSSGNFTEPTVPIQNISQGVISLFEVGARNILVPNIPDLGNVPRNLSLGPDISTALTQLSQAHNLSLATTLNNLSQTYEGINLIPLAADSLFRAAITNPAEFGLTNVTEPCLDPVSNIACANPDEYLFWDSIHPTAIAHARLGEFASSTLKAEPVPEPSSELGVLAVGVMGIVSLLKRKWRKELETWQ